MAFVALLAALIPLSANADWLTYHLDPGRLGNDSTDPTATTITAAWASPSLDGAVYAEPLIFGPNVLVATENNTIYSLDAGTGEINWQEHLGTPVPNSSLPCGNVNPVGITGTPVIDGATHTIYAVGMLSQPNIHYELFAVDASTGVLLWQQAIAPGGFNPGTQGQRGALALTSGNVYIPFGGRYGDCTPYSAWIAGVPAAGGTMFTAGPLSSSQDGGGMWAASGLAVDPSGNIYGTTGNTFCTSPCPYDYGEAVMAFNPALSLLDYYAPTNWSALNAGDVDIGGTGPAVLGTNLLFQVGKSGDAYLIHATPNMGGVSNAPFKGHACPGLFSDAAFGGVAYAAPYVYVPCAGSLEALSVNTSTPSFATAWQGPGVSFSGPPIVAGGFVWTIDPAGTLYALNPTTGAIKFQAAIGGAQHFATPAAGNGRVVVAAGGNVKAYSLTPLPALRRSPRSLSFGVQQPGTTSPGQSSTLTNIGNASLTINSIAVGSEFAQTNTCGTLPATLAPGASCTVTVTFTPSTIGTRTGAVTITDNATGSPHNIGLTGQGSNWSSFSRLGGSLTSAPAVTTWGTNRLDVFARGQDNALYHMVFDGSWHPWVRIPATMTSAPAAVSWGTNRLDVFGRGQDNAYYHNSSIDGGSNWAGWTKVGASATSAPAVASWAANRLDLFGRGQDNALYHTSSTDGGGQWSAWERLDASVTSDPAAVANVGVANHIDVFARGGDNALYQRTFDTGGWHPWARLSGTLASGPAVTSWASGRLDVVAAGQDLALYHASSTNGGTSWNPWEWMGGSVTSGPAAASWAVGHIDVFARGQDLALYQTTYNGP